MGDAQTGLEDWGKRLTTAFRRHPGLEFILLAGDLVDRGNERTNWDHFFLRAEEIFERMPVMPCVGNHEYLDMGPRLYRSFFALPRNGPAGIAPGLVYHFEVGIRLHRGSRQHPRRLRRARGKTSGGLARRRPVSDPRAVETRHVPSPGLSLTSLARHPGIAGPLGAGLRQASRRPRAPGPRSRLPANLPDARPPPRVLLASQGRSTWSRSRVTSSATRPHAITSRSGSRQTSTYQTIEIDDRANCLTYRAWTDAGEVADRLVLTHPGSAEPAVFAGRARAGVR